MLEIQKKLYVPFNYKKYKNMQFKEKFLGKKTTPTQQFKGLDAQIYCNSLKNSITVYSVFCILSIIQLISQHVGLGLNMQG